ncbi:hypothetical protein GGU10DRAFT_365460 [Lentinula aff. detonsa]|uniref:Xylosidase arabinosidase n=1 Tax=Lentinula aff. detonsa TaxID=2804958 RepID=A0AA38KPF6_9AGAR|nr:hypothetical protein GGU10DRAFT_365460 [Lentinula aff. detonsa]
MDGQDSSRVLKRADPSTIQDKFLVGYQGWFTCAGDGDPIDPGHHGWLHWFNYPIPIGGRPTIDLWPDVSEYSPSELYSVPGVTSHSGEPATLFSSRHPKTVQRHFHWMARHGVDGVFLQRFLGQCDSERGSKGMPRLRDEVNDRVQEAAEKEGRVFAIMYDVSGVEPDEVMRIFTKDWIHLVREKRILESPNYLRERGMPVIGLWGFGFDKRKDTPELVREVTRFVRDVTPGGVYIMAGTATHWRRSTEDADRNPAFLDVWLQEFDAISPWMVGRLTDEEHADTYAEHYMKADIEFLKKSHEEGGRKIDYIPVIYPGFSGVNLSQGNWTFNQIKRNGGKFMWQQIFNVKRLGLRVMYGAMWDEYDEGTALMPVVEKSRLLPRSEKYPFMALDVDGYDLPADWYMRICGLAAEGLRSERMIHETFPSKELQDYWSTRPRFEEVNSKSGDFVSGSAGELGGGQSYQNWLSSQEDNKDEAPPPPYSLEAGVPNTIPPQVQASGQSQPTDASATSDHAQNESMDARVASLASDISLQSLSSPSLANDAPASSITRPPLHPLHPSRSSSSSGASISPPPTHPSRSRPPELNRLSRPQSVSISRPHVQSLPQSQPASSNQDPAQPVRPAGRPQWPPADWDAGTNQPPASLPYQPYQPNRIPLHASLRPETSTSRPTSPYDSQGAIQHPFCEPSMRPVSPQPPMDSSIFQGPSVSFPQVHVSGPPGNNLASYTPPLGSPSFPPGPYGPAGVQGGSSHSSYTPHPSSPSFRAEFHGPTTFQPPSVPYSSRPSPSSYSTQSTFGSSYPGMSPPHSPSTGGFPDPSYSEPPPPPSQPYHMPSYPPAQGAFSQSSSSPYNDPGQWSPPSVPPRPANLSSAAPPPNQYQSYPGNYQSYPSYPQHMPSGPSSSGFTSYARSAVDKVAGQDTRQQLENKLGSLAQSGSKLFNKFTR